ncbi:uncharacterized protein LOC111394204 [Olea europaea var. sylvestris]|uniref:uncharacterized protein LOC111394204 n=1 Tax=Olea europaea var. sylvestris TaxID=158386 RepID=UPI000C1CFCFF|nr:uncharacterized protein LOC111394204 [Olea europaea var. sylvestris]
MELYDKVKEALNIDTSLYKMEISALVPIMSKAPAAPIIIDCDNNVKWFISTCTKKILCVSILNEVVENQEDFGDEGCLLVIDGGEQIENMNNEEEQDRANNDGNDDNGDGIFVDCNGFDVSEDSPRRVDDEVNSSVADDNNFELRTHEPCSRDIVNGNDVEYTQIVSESVSSLCYETSVKIPERLDVRVNQLFPSKYDLISKLQLLAMKCQFEYKVKRSNKSTYTIVCIDENCKWRLRATKIVESPIFEVRKCNGHHSCSMSVRHRDHRHASYMIIGNHIAPKYEDVNRVYRPRDIINDIRREFGITVSYTKAYMAKNFACGLIRRKSRESYAKLPAYCHVLEMQNPGTITFIHTNDDRRFKYLFMALGPSIHGFVNSMRKVISVEGAFLPSRMKGILLVTTSQDANFQIFPLAWGVVDLENDESWTWFFQKLWLIIGDTDDLVIICDRATCIKNGVRNVFRFAHHGNCTYHLQKNLKTNFPRCDVATLFRVASETYIVTKFESYMAALCSKKEGIKEYLLEEDFQC